MKLQKKLYLLFEEPEKSRTSFFLNTFIYILIILSILNLMFYSVDSIREEYGYLLELVRNIIMPLFILEYIGRIFASGYLKKYRGFQGKINYLITPYALIDLLSILPYIFLCSGFNSSFIRSLRLLRIFRLFRVKKYAIFVAIMKKIFFRIKEELSVLLFYTLIIIILLSFIIFDIEHEAQPEVFTNIFQTLWWAVATLTTVGYGDIYPITAIGKFITAIISIIGIGFVAIPGGMFASEFMNIIAEEKEKSCTIKKEQNKICPNCNTSKIKTFSNPTLHYSNKQKNFSKVHLCSKCGFAWMKK